MYIHYMKETRVYEKLGNFLIVMDGFPLQFDITVDYVDHILFIEFRINGLFHTLIPSFS
jgi:hypothetical protein